jgi:rhodanese-related sulfurtransferase
MKIIRKILMLKIFLIIIATTTCGQNSSIADNLNHYITSFDNQARREMKISSPELIDLINRNQVFPLDIRFRQEFDNWSIEPFVNIPLNELPSRLDELDRDQLIVIACPQKDRAIIAMVYLISHGFENVSYLNDGLIKMIELIRGFNLENDIIRIKGSIR